MYDRLTDSVTKRAFDLVLANWLLDETVMRLGCVYIYNGIKFDTFWHLTFLKSQFLNETCTLLYRVTVAYLLLFIFYPTTISLTQAKECRRY